jgi:hypothetical protein
MSQTLVRLSTAGRDEKKTFPIIKESFGFPGNGCQRHKEDRRFESHQPLKNSRLKE